MKKASVLVFAAVAVFGAGLAMTGCDNKPEPAKTAPKTNTTPPPAPTPADKK